MIRNFEYNPTTYQLACVLLRFGFNLSSEESPFDLLKFEVITPDSFMWKLLIDNSVYYLYAEDYVSSLDYIKNVFNDYIKSDKWSFVSPSKIIPFNEAGPVKSSRVYKEPDDSDEMMKYAADSGYDFVFLAKSSEDANDAKFS